MKTQSRTSNNKKRKYKLAYLKKLYAIIFILLIISISVIQVTGIHLVSGVDIMKSDYVVNRNIETKTIAANRGTIYDRNGEVIAKDTNTYKIIAYLDKKRTATGGVVAYVTDPVEYAKKIAPIIGETEANIQKSLSQNLYQTELGLKGKNLSISQKEEIEKLKLPGIEFETTTSRSYPNGVFASLTVGFATKNEETKKLVGAIGIESTFEDDLTGENGTEKYQVDSRGYRISNGTIEYKEAVNGNDVYLTIDSNIQRIVESNLDQLIKTNPNEMTLAIVTDARTNEILAISERPTFNPNKLNITSYLNPSVGYVYEPGSTMKVFTYAAAMDTGVYKGNDKFVSGKYYVKEGNQTVQTINDWNKTGFGKISYHDGFLWSSNTGVANLMAHYLKPKVLGEYLDKFGFFKKTGVMIQGEESGLKVFDRKQEQYTTAFGQASSTTAMQLVQAFSAITNEGTMVQPSIVKSVKTESKDIIREYQPTVVGTPIKKETSKQMLALMKDVVEDGLLGSAVGYKNKLYTVAGKTGTAEIVQNGRYLTCGTCYYTSLLMTAPASNPRINIYLVTKRDSSPSYESKQTFIKNVTTNTLQYLNIAPDKVSKEATVVGNELEIESFINKSVDYSKKKLDNIKVKYYIIGNGSTVIKQSPLPYTTISTNQVMFLLTDGNKKTMIDLSKLSRNDVLKFAEVMNINVTFKGNGYVTKQSIKKNKVIKDGMTLEVTLE